MGLVIALLVVLAGCYQPDLRDCTVTCAAADECAQGQSCTSTGLCAAAGATCTAPMIDAGMAGPLYSLRVTVSGKGEVAIDNVGSCTNSSAAMAMGMSTTCPFQVPVRAQIVAHAQVTDASHMFNGWTDPLCKDQGVTCAFTALPVTVIQAQFK